MIPPQKNLLSRKLLDERQILLAFRQLSPPRMIAGEHKSILRLYDFIDILFYFSFMILPDPPELIHGFIGLKAQMQVAQSVKGHADTSFLFLFIFSLPGIFL